jgi:hypothetical protein
VNIGAIVKRAQKATADNAPTVLTALGVTGLVTTAVLTGRASFKAAEVMAVNHHKLVDNEFEPLPVFEKVKIVFPDVWKYYVPAVGTGAVTIACIVSANHISTRRAAVLASAYSIAQEGFQEYKVKVLEKIGEKKEKEVRDEIAQDRVTKNPPAEVYVINEGEVLCMDMHSGRYFKSTLENIKAAQNKINHRIRNDNYASLTDFWDFIGLRKTDNSDEIGWNFDAYLEIDYGSAITEDGKPCITIGFQTIPVRGYYSLH